MNNIDEALAWAKESRYEDLDPIVRALAERHPRTFKAVVGHVVAGVTEEIDFPPVLQVGKFLEEVGTPPPMFVQGLLPEYSLVLVTGKPKHGKSHMAIDMLDSISRGEKIFDSFEVSRPGPVLYLGMEDGKYEIANKMLQRGIRAGDDRPLYLCAVRMPLHRPDVLSWLDKQMDEIRPVICVIDTAREALGIKDWSDASELTEKMAPIRDLARRHCTILLVAHNRKAEGGNGDEIAGSNAFTGAVDGWISIQKKQKMPDGNMRVWATADGRGGMEQAGEPVLEMDTHTRHFRLVDGDALLAERTEALLETAQKREAVILTALAGLGGHGSTRQLAEATAQNFETTKRIVKEAVARGVLVDSKLRTGRTNNVALWTTPERLENPQTVLDDGEGAL